MDTFYILITGFLVAISCGVLGSFLVLRKSAMIGDAISHAVLPGIVIAYLSTGDRNLVLMFLAAMLFGLLTSIIIEFLNKSAGVQSDAAIGITFTSLFAIGVILITRYASQVDLDEDCVLFGELLFIPLEKQLTFIGISLPFSIWALCLALCVNLSYLFLGFKGLKISTFNEEYARSLGISTKFWHFSLMALVSLTTVMSFEAVGAILVVAFFIVPASTAYLITDKLKTMLFLSVVIGIIAVICGYFLAFSLDASLSGAMVTVLGFLFFLTFIGVQLRNRRRVKALV